MPKGDCLMKPMMLHHRSLNLCALKSENKQTLPIFWRANRKLWVTAMILMDWFHNCLIPQLERYLAEKNLSFKVLLLEDNTPDHPKQLKLAHANVVVIFLPPSITSLI